MKTAIAVRFVSRPLLMLAAALTFSPLSPATDLTVLYQFPVGSYSHASVIFGTDGLIYGTTSGKSGLDPSTVFRVKPDGSDYTVLRTLNYYIEGSNVQSPVIQATDGMLYGTASYGGGGAGTVFRLNTDGTAFEVIYVFHSAFDAIVNGANPYGLLQVGDKLYGTTAYGGAYAPLNHSAIPRAGILYRINLDGSNYTIVHSFQPCDGTIPASTPILGTDGRLYGTTIYGGTYDRGVVYRVNLDGTGYQVLHQFNGAVDGNYPDGGLMQTKDGRLYGTIGGYYGGLYSLDPDGSNFSILSNTRSPLGMYQYGTSDSCVPLEGPDGAIYATFTFVTSQSWGGSVYKVNRDGSGYTTLQFFTGVEGRYTQGVRLGPDGRLYGTTQLGGLNNAGTIFALGNYCPQAPVITSAPAATGTYGSPFNYTITATNNPTLFTAVGLPLGLNTTATTGLITGTPAQAGTFTADLGAANAAGIGTNTLSLLIAKAPATLTFDHLTQTYDGTPKYPLATTSPAGLAVSLAFSSTSTPTNAGSYPVTCTIIDSNYTGTAADTLTITPAPATIALTNLNQTYSGAPTTVNVTTTPLGLVTLTTYNGSRTPPTNAGSYAVTATTNNPNYTGSASGTLTIAKATPLLTWNAPAAITYGTPLGTAQLTATTHIPGTLTYTPAAGTILAVGANRTLTAAFTPADTANYTTATATTSITVNPAAASVTLGSLTQTYTGTAKTVTATTTPARLTVLITYNGSTTPPVNAGNYAVAATIVDANYTGSAVGTLIVNKATAALALGNLSQTYTGSSKSATATTNPAGLPVLFTYNGSATAPTNAGSYPVVATINHANYTGWATGTLVITKAPATIALGQLNQAYDGTPKTVTTATTPAGLSVSVAYNGTANLPTPPGTYSVTATITDPNHTGSASGALTITIAALVRHAPTLNGELDGSIQVTSAENITLNGNAAISGDLLVPGTPALQINGHPTFGGLNNGTGNTVPINYTVTLSGNALLRYLVRRTDPTTLPTVSAPPAPTGTRDVTINAAGQSAGNFATVRNLTLNGNVGLVTVPPGTYGSLTANGNSGFILGVAGATTPAVYNLQSLTLNGSTQVQIAGPVVLLVNTGPTINSTIGSDTNPAWLTLKVFSGGVTLNGNIALHGFVIAPNGTVTINGNSTLHGGVVADRLIINGNGLLK